MFPNLNLAERRLLTRLLETRNAVALRRQTASRHADTRPARQRSLSACERKLKQLQMRVCGLRHTPVLTPLQRAVLQEILGGGPRKV